MPVRVAPASSSRLMAGAVSVAGDAAAYQSGLPIETLRPSMAKRSLTMNVRPASGPETLPAIGSCKVWGTRAPTRSATGVAVMHLSLRRARYGMLFDFGPTPYNSGNDPGKCRNENRREGSDKKGDAFARGRMGAWPHLLIHGLFVRDDPWAASGVPRGQSRRERRGTGPDRGYRRGHGTDHTDALRLALRPVEPAQGADGCGLWARGRDKATVSARHLRSHRPHRHLSRSCWQGLPWPAPRPPACRC